MTNHQKPKPKPKIPVKSDIKLPSNYYFDNPLVERLLTEYVKGGCVDVALRNEIMTHASELITQVIRTHNLQQIYPGQDAASFGDLFQVAWNQIEKVLYKFDYKPGHTKVFNMWSQVCKTVLLAHIKRENRDRKNHGAYKTHLGDRTVGKGAIFTRWLDESREIFRHNDEFLIIIDALEHIYNTDDRPFEGIIGKLVEKTGMSRAKIHQFLLNIRLRAGEFTDSPINSKDDKLGKYSLMEDHDDSSDE